MFVPLGYKPATPQLANVEEAHGGSPWGAGTITVSCFLFGWFQFLFGRVLIFWQGMDGKREPSVLELEMAFAQGKDLYETVSKVF
jgi:NAD(P)H dehydrogenase (quinone)